MRIAADAGDADGRPLRLLTVGNRYPPEGFGGYEALWQDTVQWLRDRGHTVTVLACDLPLPPGAAEAPAVRRALRWYWRDHAFPRISLRGRYALERHNRTVLARAIAELRPDAVMWFSMGGMSLSLIGQVRDAGLPAVGVIGDEWLAYGPRVDAWTRLWNGRLTRRLPAPEHVSGIPTRYRPAGAARWVFISQMLVRRTALYRVEVGRHEVAHPGIDAERFRPGPAKEWAGRLLYAGRIDPRKGIATAVRALPSLPAATLTVDGAGDEHHADELRALAAGLGVGDRVVFTRSARDRLAGTYAAADVALHPVEWEEPWGLAPLEAMACGTPVVATGMGGSGEYLRDGENALLVAPGDAAALAVAIDRLAGDRDLRARLRDGALVTAARFTAEAFFAAVERAVRAEVAGAGRSAPGLENA